MQTIWKYELPIATEFTIDMPREAQILDVQVQHGKPCLWALVESGNDMEKRGFYLGTTGSLAKCSIGDGALQFKHLGTFQTDGGSFVGHLFG